MHLGCRLGVADSMRVDRSQVVCLIMSMDSMQHVAESESLRRLFVETFGWHVFFVIAVPSNDTANVEQHIESVSSNHREFESTLNRRLLEIVKNQTALVETYELGQLSLVLASKADYPQLQAIVWISYLLGRVRCDEEGQLEVVRSTGNATAVCFGKNDTEVVDGAACQVKGEGAYAVSVPSAIFEDTTIE
eukprot:5363017-Amphidinium_carterae.1